MQRRSQFFDCGVHSGAVNEMQRQDEQGFMLVGLIVAIFLILLVLGVAAPKVARDLRREREVEAVHRGNQYVRAIQLYFKKFGYPASMDQLEKSNNIRYLRQRYTDPMTGKADWRLIKMGEAKTTVKGFFGQPLGGLATGGLGGGSGTASPGIGSSGSGPFGSSSPGLVSTMSGSTGATGPEGGSGLGGATGPGGSTGPSGSNGPGGSTGGVGSQSATTFSGGGAQFVGVGSAKSGESIIDLNEQTTYQTWEFLYDPRIEQMKARASLFGGGAASVGSTNLGSSQQNPSPGIGGSTGSTAPTTTPTPAPAPPSSTPQY
ncbi:MAG: putative secretion/fimbrial assembly protein [Edaphobacter sp.]|nr:putative secretion/fimbrial assembly protein [Edaphobacter sp.]